MVRWGWLAIAAIGAVMLAIIASTPPGPVPASADANRFAAGRAMQDIRVFARLPHPTGSAADAAARAYLVKRLRGMGLVVETRSAPLRPIAAERLAKWRGTPAPPPLLTNIIATLPGRDRAKPAVLLMAHHDSVWGSPGAADDGAGTGAALEITRALIASGAARQRDLIVLLTDGEELGLEGARAFFANDPNRDRIGVVVNMETRGGGGRASMFETGPDNGAMMALFGRHVAAPVGTSLSVYVYHKLPNDTDYTIARERGIAGFNFAFIGRPGLYHSPLATPEALDQGALQDMGRQALDLTRGLLAAQTLPGQAPDAVFFDAYGLFLISYPAGLGWVLLAVAIAGYGVAGWRGGSAGAIVRGAGLMIALIVVAPVLLYLGNLASGADGPVNYYDRLAAIPRLEGQALLLCIAALTLVVGLISGSRETNRLTVGAALPLLALAVFVQATAPTAAFLLTMPLLLGGVAAALSGWGSQRIGSIASALAAALGVGWLLAIGHFLMQGVGPGLPMVAALPLALAAALLLPLIPAVGRGTALRATGALTLAGLAIALWVRLDPIAPSVAVYSIASSDKRAH